jgi:hypothetical protein
VFRSDIVIVFILVLYCKLDHGRTCFGYVSLPIDASMTWLTTIPLDKVIHFITKLKINYEQNSLLLEKTFTCMFDLKSHTQH